MELTVGPEVYNVTFPYAAYRNIIEPGPHAYEWALTQAVKSWLSTNTVKVFVDFDCGDFGESSPVTTFMFTSKSDATAFYEQWRVTNSFKT